MYQSGRRLCAALIDFLATLCICTAVTAAVTRGAAKINAPTAALSFGLFAVLFFFRDATFKNQSIGKRLMKLKTVSVKPDGGSRADILIKRNLSLAVYPFELILAVSNGRRMGDLLAGTAVVDVNQTAAVVRGREYANLKVRRLCAALIDYFIAAVLPTAVLMVIARGRASRDLSLTCLDFVMAFALLFFRDATFKNRSIGKRLMGLKTVSVKPDGGSCADILLLRNITLFFFPLEIIALLCGGRRVGDRIAKTAVTDAGE